MSGDGRLELDDVGRPLDGAQPEALRDDLTEPSPLARRLVAVLGGSVSPSRPRLAIALLVTVLIGVVVLVGRSSGAAPPLVVVDVQGISARVVGGNLGTAAPEVLASYDLRVRSGTARIRIVSLHGQGIRSSKAARSDGAPGTTQSVQVVPDCRRLLAAGDSPDYELELQGTDASGSPVTSLVASFDGGSTLTAAAVQACWAYSASRDLTPVDVVALPGSGPWTDLDVMLRNGIGVPASVTAVPPRMTDRPGRQRR